MATKPKLPPGPLQKTCADPRLAAFFSAPLNCIPSIFNRQHSLHQPGSHKPSHKPHSSTLVITGLHAYFLHRMGFRVRETRYLLGSATLYRVWCKLLFPCLVSPTIEMGIIIYVPELLSSRTKDAKFKNSCLKQIRCTHTKLLSLQVVSMAILLTFKEYPIQYF